MQQQREEERKLGQSALSLWDRGRERRRKRRKWLHFCDWWIVRISTKQEKWRKKQGQNNIVIPRGHACAGQLLHPLRTARGRIGRRGEKVVVVVAVPGRIPAPAPLLVLLLPTIPKSSGFAPTQIFALGRVLEEEVLASATTWIFLVAVSSAQISCSVGSHSSSGLWRATVPPRSSLVPCVRRHPRLKPPTWRST